MIKFTASLWQRALPLALFACLINNTAASLANSGLMAPNASRSDAYISDISGDGLYRWTPDRFPLKVYMKPGSGLPGYRDYYPDVLRKCFDDWTQRSNGKLSWKEVSSPKNADITVGWSDQAVEAANGTEAGKTKTFAKYNTQTNWGTIDRAEMRLLTKLPEREFADSEIRKAWLHEVGHAFGIAGHSSDPNDIMYFAVSKRNPGELSNRDIATMSYLYQQQNQNQATMIGSAPRSNEQLERSQSIDPYRQY